LNNKTIQNFNSVSISGSVPERGLRKTGILLVLEWGTGYFAGLHNLHRSSVSRPGGRRECKQLSLESIFLKKDLLFFTFGPHGQVFRL